MNIRKELNIAIILILLLSTPAFINGQNPAPSNLANQTNEQDEVVRVDTNLVTIPASAMDRQGRYVTDLRKEDFQIFEDGVEQEVAFFAPVEKPFTILFLLDTSSSMTLHKEDMGRAANAFVSQLRPDDHLIAATFYQWVDTLIQDAKVSEVRKGVNLKIRQGDDCSTLIYDAVDNALKRMKKIHGRKAIVLFSDGIGAESIATAKGNLHDAEEMDVLIYTIQFGSFPAVPPRFVSSKAYFKRIEEINGYMRDLAQKTGGRHYQVENISNLEETFGMVANELRRQYSLGYYPKNHPEVGQRRQIKVKMRLPNLVVRARDSYIVQTSKNR